MTRRSPAYGSAEVSRPAAQNGQVPLRVLYLNPAAQWGGAEKCLFDLVTHLDRSRFEPLVVLPYHGSLGSALVRSGVSVMILPWPEGFVRFGRNSRLDSAFWALPAPLFLCPHVLEICAL